MGIRRLLMLWPIFFGGSHTTTCGFVAPRAPWTTTTSARPRITTPTTSTSTKKNQKTTTTTSTELYMVFDFFKQRSEEGLQQLSKLSSAASQGKLGQALVEAAEYTKQSNQAFADGLAKSRNRLLQNLDSLLSGVGSGGGIGGVDPLDELQDVLLQADLGMATADDIVAEVKSLRDDSTTFLSKDDLLSVMRGKLIETLQTEKGAIQFASEDSKLPTVLFILGANGMGK
jgi:signal recognition particle GTPase